MHKLIVAKLARKAMNETVGKPSSSLVGKRCKMFTGRSADGRKWEETGDIDNNEIYIEEGVITRHYNYVHPAYQTQDECVDIKFDRGNRTLTGFFAEGVTLL